MYVIFFSLKSMSDFLTISQAIRMRYQTVTKQQAAERQAAAATGAPAEEEDDDYEPEYQPMDVSEGAPAEKHPTTVA